MSATDLLALTAELVDIPSLSHEEAALADRVEGERSDVGALEVTRIDDNVLARTDLGRDQRLVLAGHLDTVRPHDNTAARIEGDVCWGLGSADMKAGLAAFLALARTLDSPALDLTFAFYACEEVAHAHSGLGKLFDTHPELLAGDAAVVGEPTGAHIEAGCQGTLRVAARFDGRRAHTARPWLGRNAIHRLGPVLERIEGSAGREVRIDGCEFRESTQAVAIEGGHGGNVVPDRALLTVNHRFAPDRSPEQARRHVAELLVEADVTEEIDFAPAAPPALDHPLLAALAADERTDVRAKLGWTDVARFAAHGIPATNFGPGDPAVAHTAEEHVDRAQIERVFAVLQRLVIGGPPAGTLDA